MTDSTHRVQEALRALQRGEIGPALEKLMSAHIADPLDFDVRYYLGVAATQAREYELAIKELTAVAIERGRAPAVLFHLGQAYWGGGDLERAAAHFDEAIAGQERYPEAYAMLGAVRLAQQELTQAEAALHRALRYDPDLGAARANLANVLIARGAYEEAEALLRESIERDPTAEQAFANYLSILRRRGAIEEGLSVLTALIEAHPQMARPRAYRAEILAALGRRDEAVEDLEYALTLDPGRVASHANLAVLFMEEGRLTEAVPVLNHAVERFPKDTRLNGLMGMALDGLGRRRQALRFYERALVTNPDSVEARAAMLTHRIADGDLEGAESLVEEIRKVRPDYDMLDAHLASIRDRQGRSAEAAELLEGLMERGLASSMVVTSYVSLRHSDPARVQRAIDVGEAFLAHTTHDHNLRTVRFALAKTLDRVGEHESAFRHMAVANQEKPNEYDRREAAESFAAIRSVFSAGFQTRMPAGEVPERTPVFICGMPRSGTSLTEQVLASHSAMTGGGELLVLPDLIRLLPTALGTGRIYPHYVAGLDEDQMVDIGAEYIDAASELVGGTNHFTDKLPQNFLNLGFIDRILPGSKIIHCRRNPMDTCLSIFGIDFFGAHPYAYSQDDLGHYYSLYLDLMEHWRSVGIEMLEVRYEDTVSDLERSARRMLEFIGLDWEPGLLDFHKSGREVATASYQQVRQPLYKTSMERWRRYEEQLQPLYGILGDATREYMAELGK